LCVLLIGCSILYIVLGIVFTSFIFSGEAFNCIEKNNQESRNNIVNLIVAGGYSFAFAGQLNLPYYNS